MRMNNSSRSDEQFRKNFVLVMTIGYTIAFLLLISGFFHALLLAAVFSGVVYPLYLWIQKKLGDHDTLASLLTLTLTLLVIVVPLVYMLGLISEQAVNVASDVKPWIDIRLNSPVKQMNAFPDWVPFAKQLEPYHAKIISKVAEFTGTAGGYLAESLAKLSQGTVSFFFQLFIMLYSMFFFLTDGPAMLHKILSYVPLSENDKNKILNVGLSVSRATVKGTLIIGIIQGVLGGLGFAVAGIKAAVFWGSIMAVMSVLPGIGTALIWGPAVGYLLLSGQIATGLGLLAWSAGIVGSVDNFLRPVLVGRDTKMPDLLILLSTLGGLGLFGASGLVLGPILAALFLAVLAIYSRVFADWLNVDQSSGGLPDNVPKVVDITQKPAPDIIP